MSFQELTQAALDLPVADRESLGYALLRSVGLDDEWDESDLSNEVLEQRSSEMKNDASRSLPLEEVFPELKADIARK